ncbi:MAG: hypothetical protein A2Y40_04110 [Candidatus Margulisbacteria bacterium GWF2_35_9]|nr:MAG: hypothetical protein A2Y40_04110 [Candidatus Margulisbacteria bacterium GWF2_35_9]
MGIVATDTEIQGQMKHKLKQLFQTNRFVTSYIFVGQNREQKKTAAKFIAKYLNCKSKENKPCNVCAVCKMIDEEKFYGFLSLNIMDETNQSSVKMDDIRQLKRDVSYGGYNGWQIVYICDAHQLTASASNSLLKTLEESPKNVIFILDTPNQYLLLPTIISRSQVIIFGNTSKMDYSSILFSDISVDKFLNFVENKNITEIIFQIDKEKIDRILCQQRFEELIDCFFNKYRIAGEDKYLAMIKSVRKHRKYLDRPVNATTNLLLLALEIKDYL